MLDERWELSRRTNQEFRNSIALRMEAELVLASSPTPIAPDAALRAEDFYAQSIADARKRGAKTYELKTLLRLLDLVRGTNYRGTDREQEVLGTIRERYSSFTEGFDVPLLQRTAAVLESSSIHDTD